MSRQHYLALCACAVGVLAWGGLTAADPLTINTCTPSDAMSGTAIKVIVTGSGFQASGSYPVGTVAHNGHGYLYLPTLRSWGAADAACRALGGTLATITSAEENGVVLGTVTDAGPGFWIDLSVTEIEGVYAWNTGEVLGYTNWAPTEPNNPGEEDRVEVYLDFGLVGRWNNLAGTELRPAVCEFHGGGPVAPSVALLGPRTIIANQTVFLSPDRLQCTFILDGAPSGSYALRVTNADSGQATLVDALSIVGGLVNGGDGPPNNVGEGGGEVMFGGIGSGSTNGCGGGNAAGLLLLVAMVGWRLRR